MKTSKKPELLLPAGNEECLRAAVNNGADAVYIGLNRFNARENASNFDENSLSSAVKYCHERDVKVYVTFNTLVKNHELNQYFGMISAAYSAGADAIIIQDPCFIPLIRKNFPSLPIHLSTQATATNSYSVPDGVKRVILPRELSLEEIRSISKKYETEIFVHGALCLSYSGQCLFSSMIGGRSGNRGKCAQPCRKIYNNRYLLSTIDLCMLEKLPELAEAGVSAFKIEGRLRSPLYVATAARIYRKYIDLYCSHGNPEDGRKKFVVDKKDIDALKIAFNREFTTGFAFNESILDPQKPMNRGLYIGTLEKGKIILKGSLKVGDGIGIWLDDKVIGQKIEKMIKDGSHVSEAKEWDVVEIGLKTKIESPGKMPVYKTSSSDMELFLGDEIKKISPAKKKEIMIPEQPKIDNNDSPKIFVKVYNKKSAVSADKANADIIYYDIMREDCAEVKKSLRHSIFFVFTPRILSDEQAEKIAKRIDELKPDGVLVGNRGLLKLLEGYELHLDYSFNCFNDIDLACYEGTPIISPELNFKELTSLKNKRFIALVHGDIILMTTRQKLNVPELVDGTGAHFRVRRHENFTEILNSKQIGLFNRVNDYVKEGIKYFYIDDSKDPGKSVRIYRHVLDGNFDDTKIRKGYTKGHFERGVY